jgi:predicted DNA-binding protein YlxM (UPF0122 family)
MKEETLSGIARKRGISRQAVWLSTKKGKAYRQTPKYKAYLKAYRKEYRAIVKIALAEYKAKLQKKKELKICYIL